MLSLERLWYSDEIIKSPFNSSLLQDLKIRRSVVRQGVLQHAHQQAAVQMLLIHASAQAWDRASHQHILSL